MSVTAKATVTLEIKCKSHWDDDTTVAQVRKQAEQDAMDLLNKNANAFGGKVTMIGTPQITIVHIDV